MKRTYLSATVLLLALLLSCTDINRTIDEELRFEINTAPGSKGLSSYRMPLSDQLERIPQDPKNRLTEDKVLLGQLLFHEPGFATASEFLEMTQTYSCATCHHAGGGFQANVVQGIGDGGIGYGTAGEGRRVDLFVEMSKIDAQSLRTPSAMNTAYQSNLFWNGQFGATAVNIGTESEWPTEGPLSINRLGYEGTETAAIAGLDIHRHKYDETSIDTMGYKEMFDKAFSDFPIADRYSNETAGLAIAAFERTMLSNQAPFQKWLRGGTAWMSDVQKEGAKLFFGKAECYTCHNGGGLASMEFHAIGMKDFDPSKVVNFDPFDKLNKGRSSFTGNSDDDYKFKVPQLYNLKDSPFYGHGGSFSNIREVVVYKNEGQAEHSRVRTSQLSPNFAPLGLSEEEIDQLTDFIENALYDPNLSRYEPSSLLSEMCFPNNDWMSQEDLGCE